MPTRQGQDTTATPPPPTPPEQDGAYVGDGLARPDFGTAPVYADPERGSGGVSGLALNSTLGGAAESIGNPGAGHGNAADVLGTLGDDFAQQGFGEMGAMNDARDKSMGMYEPATSAYDGAYGVGGTLATPGTGEQAFDTMGADTLNNTQSSDAYDYATGVLPGNNPQGEVLNRATEAFDQPGAQQQFLDYAANKWSGPSSSDQTYDMGRDKLSGPGQQQQGLDQYGQDVVNNKYLNGTEGYKQDAAGSSSYTTDMYNRNADALTGPGSMEQFAERALNTETDPYYQNLQKQMSRQIDQSFNARGGYNSGAALAAQALGSAKLAADQYHQMADIQDRGQSAQNTRLDTGLDYGKTASDVTREGADTAAGIGTDAADVQNRGYQTYFDAASGADKDTVDRMNTLGDLSQSADTTDINRMKTLGDTARGVDTNETNQWKTAGDMADDTGKQTTSNVSTLGDLGHTAAADALSGQKTYYDMAADAEGLTNDRVQGGITTAAGIGKDMADTYIDPTQQGIEDYNKMLLKMSELEGAAQDHAVAADDKNQDGAMGIVKKIVSV